MAQQPSNQLATQMQQQMMQAQAAQAAQMQQQQQQLQSQSQHQQQQQQQQQPPQQQQLQQQTAHGHQLQQTGRPLDEPTSLARLRADDVRQWCEAFDKHELVDIIVGISDTNAQFQSFLGHALVTDIKWCKIRVTFPNDLNTNESLLNYKPRKEDLFNVFKEFGAMNKIEIVLNPINNENNGIPYALITFRRYTDAQAAVSQGYHELIVHKEGGGSNTNTNDDGTSNNSNNSGSNGGETKNIRVSCCYAFENEESNDGGDADMNGNDGVRRNTNGTGGNSNNGNNNNNLGQLQSQQQQRMGGGSGGFVAQQLASFSQEGIFNVFLFFYFFILIFRLSYSFIFVEQFVGNQRKTTTQHFSIVLMHLIFEFVGFCLL